MTIDRAEQAGLGASVAGHLLLFAVLYAGYQVVKPAEPPKRPSMEVSIVAETGLESGAPEISTETPAPKLAEEDAPIQPEPPAPVPEPAPLPRAVPQPVARPVPQPVAKPQPVPKPSAKPVPKAVVKPQPKPTPKPAAKPPPARPAEQKAQAAPRSPAKANSQSQSSRSGGRLSGILDGITDADTRGRSTKAPAATITPAIQSSLAASIIRQIKPHWEGPSGADVDALKTVLRLNLSRDGRVTDIQFVGTSGINASNRSIAPVHKERAIKAVRLASPFQLPANLYDGWKEVTVNFDWRL